MSLLTKSTAFIIGPVATLLGYVMNGIFWVLEKVGITANKNTVPNDPQSPFVTSGIRLGAAAMTTRGFKEEDMKETARIISEAIKNSDDETKLSELRKASLELCKKYPLY